MLVFTLKRHSFIIDRCFSTHYDLLCCLLRLTILFLALEFDNQIFVYVGSVRGSRRLKSTNLTILALAVRHFIKLGEALLTAVA